MTFRRIHSYVLRTPILLLAHVSLIHAGWHACYELRTWVLRTLGLLLTHVSTAEASWDT